MIEFILDNLFLVLVILGALFSLFSRNKQPETRRRPRTQQEGMPPFGRHPAETHGKESRAQTVRPRGEESGMPPFELPKDLSDELREVASTVKQTEREEKSSAYERPYEEPYERKRKTPYARRYSEPYARSEQAADKTPFAAERLPRRAVEGMMWSEVLGHRAGKKPFRPRYRR